MGTARKSRQALKAQGSSQELRIERSFHPSWMLYAILILAAGAGAVWWWKRKRKSPPPKSPKQKAAKPAQQAAAPSISRKTLSGTRNKEYAGFWIRLVGAFLDGILIGIPAIIALLVIAFLISRLAAIVVSFGVLALVVYLEGVKGGTPGKLILRLRIVNDKGQAIGWAKSILRNVGKGISSMILGIGFFMIGWTSNKQGLHDMIAGTYVVRED